MREWQLRLGWGEGPGYRWFYVVEKGLPWGWEEKPREGVLPHGIKNNKSWISEDLGRGYEERGGGHRKMAFKIFLPKTRHVEGEENTLSFFEGNYRPPPILKVTTFYL